MIRPWTIIIRYGLRTAFKLFAIRLALRKRPPRLIPMSGEALQTRNYFTIRLRGVAGNNRPREVAGTDAFTVTRIEGAMLRGVFFHRGFSPGFRARLKVSHLSATSIEIDHYLRELQIRYESPTQFILQYLVWYNWIRLYINRTQQKLFNRKRLVRSERLQILRLFMDHTLTAQDPRLDLEDLMARLYGHRWAGHPDAAQLRRYYRVLLNSLVESGDLASPRNLYGIGYQLEPKAFTTLAQFEQEDARHQELVRMQRLLVFVTAALVIVGVLQTAPAIVEALRP